MKVTLEEEAEGIPLQALMDAGAKSMDTAYYLELEGSVYEPSVFKNEEGKRVPTHYRRRGEPVESVDGQNRNI